MHLTDTQEQYVKAMEKRRRRIDSEYRALSAEVIEAFDAGLPVKRISDAARLSRTTVYKYLESAGRGPGGK